MKLVEVAKVCPHGTRSLERWVATINRCGKYLVVITAALLRYFREHPHPVKFTDSTDIPVCLNKNGRRHKTMYRLAAWSKTDKGSFYGLKLHLSGDAEGRPLAIRLTPGNSDDRAVFRTMNEKLRGLFATDAGYVSEQLERDFFIEHKRAVITATRKNMKKIAAPWQIALLNLRMRVEIHFRVLKVCYELVTSLPRSIDGYLTHYLAAIAAHLLAQVLTVGFFSRSRCCFFGFQCCGYNTQTAVACLRCPLDCISLFTVIIGMI